MKRQRRRDCRAGRRIWYRPPILARCRVRTVVKSLHRAMKMEPEWISSNFLDREMATVVMAAKRLSMWYWMITRGLIR